MSGNTGLVLILDDERVVRYQLERIFQQEGYSTKSFSSAEELFADDAPSVPACLLLDVNIAGSVLDGPATHEKLQGLGWMLPIVFITAHATVSMAVKALKSGAIDVLTKPIDRSSVLPAVEKALARARELRKEQVIKTKSKGLLLQLTRREQEVVSWIIAGKLNKQIAAILGITERTVKAHRASIMEKLRINSVAELVRLADQMGIRQGED